MLRILDLNSLSYKRIVHVAADGIFLMSMCFLTTCANMRIDPINASGLTDILLIRVSVEMYIGMIPLGLSRLLKCP